MLKFFKGKDKGNIIYAPCKGRVVPLAEVPDPVFADKVLGDGFAVIPADGRIYAPADGEVAMVFDTLHAVTLTSTQGAEILIHIGLDTVTLKGEPFKAHVAAGDKVKKGDLLIEADLDKIEKAGLNTIIPVLICNTDDYGKISLQKEGDVSSSKTGKSVNASSGSTADLWYPHGYRILVMSGNYAGWRHSWRSQSDRSVSG